MARGGDVPLPLRLLRARASMACGGDVALPLKEQERRQPASVSWVMQSSQERWPTSARWSCGRLSKSGGVAARVGEVDDAVVSRAEASVACVGEVGGVSLPGTAHGPCPRYRVDRIPYIPVALLEKVHAFQAAWKRHPTHLTAAETFVDSVTGREEWVHRAA